MRTQPRDSNVPVLVIDRRTPAPQYHQLHLALRDAIASGHYPAASILPSEPALARQLRSAAPPCTHRHCPSRIAMASQLVRAAFSAST